MAEKDSGSAVRLDRKSYRSQNITAFSGMISCPMTGTGTTVQRVWNWIERLVPIWKNIQCELFELYNPEGRVWGTIIKQCTFIEKLEAFTEQATMCPLLFNLAILNAIVRDRLPVSEEAFLIPPLLLGGWSVQGSVDGRDPSSCVQSPSVQTFCRPYIFRSTSSPLSPKIFIISLTV